MRKNMELSKEKIESLVERFYEYFETGYEFEEFLKIFLEKMGLDEVYVTQRSRDGGIDLKAIRNGIGGFSESDMVEYYIQAKRYKPSSSISVSKIRELKGTIPFANKGVFITTAKFSADAIKEASNDKSKPVILIDGKQLVLSCIDNEIGFVYTPEFSAKALDVLKNNVSSTTNSDSAESGEDYNNVFSVEKVISVNDIRARILRVPKAIFGFLAGDCMKLEISFNGLPVKEFNLDKTRTYIGGVTDIYKKYGLISCDGSYVSQKAIWRYDDGKILVELEK